MKKLIAAAVAAAVIAPASVMAAGPTLYGKIHTSIDYKDNNGGSYVVDGVEMNNEYNEWSLNSNSSRIGVKGSEDLGNGMKVGYLIEWGTSMDDGTNALSTRNRAITLSGDWGTMLAGKWDTPMKTVGRKFDLFGDRIGDTRTYTASNPTMDNRADNVLAYVTPNMAGFSATVAYVLDYSGATAADDQDFDAWSFNALYNNGPLMLGLGYVDYSDGDIVDAENSSAWRLGGSFKIGDFKILGTYTDMSDQALTDGADGQVWTVGGSFGMGNNTIKLQYADASYDNAAADGSDVDSDMWTIGLDHAMSKRTSVYVVYASVDNDDGSAFAPWANGGHDKEANGTALAGEDADAFSVGIIHKF